MTHTICMMSQLVHVYHKTHPLTKAVEAHTYRVCMLQYLMQRKFDTHATECETECSGNIHFPHFIAAWNVIFSFSFAI